MNNRIAFVTGGSGQDGSYLIDLLISKNYEVHGLIRQTTQFTPDKWGHLRNAMHDGKFNIHYGDMTDASSIRTLIETIRPHEVYNLAAQSHVGLSFDQPINTTNITALGPLNLLEAIRRTDKNIRFFQASSSEMFGKVQETPQNETTRFYPRSPYGCAKVYAHYVTQNYREAYGMFACSAIMFNHESERRGEDFVTRKITRAIGRIVAGTQHELVLGDTNTKRDWGYAPDYVGAMWLMLQQLTPVDYVIGTGHTHSVQEFIDEAFFCGRLDPSIYIKHDPKLFRPSEVDTLCADPKRALNELKWKPRVDFKELILRMVTHDVKLAQHEKELYG